LRILAGLVLAAAVLRPVAAQPKPVAEWVLVPDYRLPHGAGKHPGPRVELPYQPAAFATAQPALLLMGEPASHTWEPLFDHSVFRAGRFAIELMVHDHSDLPVGAGAFLRSGRGAPLWALVYRHRDVSWTHFRGEAAGVRIEKKSEWRSAFQRYWRHIVLSVDQGEATLWVNADRAGQARLPAQEADSGIRLSLSAFTSADPLMKLEDLVQEVRIYDRPLDDAAVRARFDEASGAVQRGIVYPGLFHFNAGPILSHVTENSATLVFETDRPTTAVVDFGPRLPLDRKAAGKDQRTIHQVQLSDLTTSTLYYYHVRARDSGGKEIDAGPFTFRTASAPGEPVSFAVMGDTEARPHVNDRVAKLIWDQRPDFVLNLGDITDGGVKARKAEWNLEYFLALTQLHSRIPVFAVPGNGEYGNRELFWYQQYMAAPLDQGNAPGYYSFRYGDAEFFMLDSNPRQADFKPGGLQYRWLEERLAKSTARWKLVCHHHPIYTSADHGSTAGKPADPVDRDALPIAALYERYGVDIAFAGHIHHYERSHPLREGKAAASGVIYVTSGGGGGNLQGFGPVRSWFTAMTHLGYHFCAVSITGPKLEFRMYDIDGGLRDRFELIK